MFICGNANAQAPLPVPDDPTDNPHSIECESLEVMLGDASDTLEALKKQIAAKQARIAQVDRMLGRTLAYRQTFINAGQPVPPGVDDLIDLYRNNWLPQLNQELRKLQNELNTATQNWSDLWDQWETADC